MLVFTVVTIIFLPLSTVASILGMNTSDVRDMDDGQWVFWATALPPLLLILGVCFAWIGDVRGIGRSLSGLFRSGRGGAVAMPPAEMVMAGGRVGGESGRARTYGLGHGDLPGSSRPVLRQYSGAPPMMVNSRIRSCRW